MNIFFLSRDPVEAAQLQHNKHVVKMTLETAQLLSCAHHCFGSTAPYKKTHENHPTSLWVRSAKAHYEWAYEHLKALSDEYTRRYGRIHKTWTTCAEPLKALPPGIPDVPWEDPPQCMPEAFHNADTLKAYNDYYADKIKDW